VGEHLLLSGLALAIAALIAIPLGITFGHTKRGGFLALNLANIGRALPSLALLSFALPLSFALGLGLGFWPTFFAMVPLGIPPILTNSYVGVREVDPDVVEAARGMGMKERQILLHAELPIAAPLIIAGVRNAAVAIVATATLGAVVAGGGLGRYIVDGFALQEHERLFAGALLVALLAIGVELAFAGFERLVVSRGVRESGRPVAA
jgi:osmoprotectant transport system permease protein